jgi:hypothetical protein
MRIFQTFWTKPMDKEKLMKNTYIAVLSLMYAKKSGYNVIMYTDSIGYELLKNFEYDEVNKELDNIPEDVNPKQFFAYPKFFAGLKESVGSMHIDFDVFLKKPCINSFFEDKSIDVVLQCKEGYVEFYKEYINGRKKLSLNKHPKTLKINHLHSSNVGIIGFNNKELKDIYYSWYFDYIDFYKDKLNYLVGVSSELFSEQINIDYIIQQKGYKCLYILPEDTGENHIILNKCADEIGYQHLQGGGKYRDETFLKIKDVLNKKFPDAFNKVNNLFNVK